MAEFMQYFYRDPATLTPYKTVEGDTYVQPFQVFPILEPLYFKWEKEFTVHELYKHIYLNPWVPIVGVVAYVLMIVIGRRLMRDRKPFNLKTPLMLWNLSLSIFSFFGMVRALPYLLYMLEHHGYRETICGKPTSYYADGATGFWAAAFMLSKLVELIDTLFIVLRKKPLIFLHWYHHVSVLLFTWYAYAFRHPGIW